MVLVEQAPRVVALAEVAGPLAGLLGVLMLGAPGPNLSYQVFRFLLHLHLHGAVVLSSNSAIVVHTVGLPSILPALGRLRAAGGAAQSQDCGGGGFALRAGGSFTGIPGGASRCGSRDSVRLVRQFLCADPQPGGLRYFPFRGRGVSAAAGPDRE